MTVIIIDSLKAKLHWKAQIQFCSILCIFMCPQLTATQEMLTKLQ